jgi:hypothetical protein
VNSELASLALSLMQILLSWQLENLVADLETDWFELLLNLVARGHHLAEVVVSDAVEFRHVLAPLLLQVLEHGVRYSNIGTASVDDGSIFLLLARLLTLSQAVEHILTFKSPLLH